MAESGGDRAKYFPAIERAHGQPVQHWFDLLAELGEATYAQQMALLQEGHGFSRAHANALVMTHRGSPSAKRVASPEAWFDDLAPEHAVTARAIVAAIRERFPDLELVIAWNQPMLRTDAGYVFGLSVAKHHLTCNPFSAEVLADCAPAFAGLKVNSKTFVVPVGWEVDPDLLAALVSARLAELSAGG